MSTRLSLSLDRFEGKGKEVAVLLTDDDQTINFPRSLLPSGSKPGDVLTMTLERDQGATRALNEETQRVEDRLKERDPGGDIKL
jgi:hypothetical protein